MTYDAVAAALLAAVVGLAIYGSRMRTEANSWHSNHLNELHQLQQRVRNRFNRQVFEFIKTNATSTNSIEDLTRNSNQIGLDKKIEELSRILTEEKEVNDNYDAIKENRRKEGGTLVVIAIFVALSAVILLTLGDDPLIVQSMNGSQQPSLQLLTLVFTAIIIGVIGTNLKSYDDGYNKRIDWHQEKMKVEHIDPNRSGVSEESNQSDDDG